MPSDDIYFPHRVFHIENYLDTRPLITNDCKFKCQGRSDHIQSLPGIMKRTKTCKADYDTNNVEFHMKD